MVFLTRLLCLRAPVPDPYWRKQLTKRLTWHFHGRNRNCYKLSQSVLRRALRNATLHRELKRENMKQLFQIRIAAGCAEHGVQFSAFMGALREMNVELSLKVLADLSIYEPRTFQSLCELVKRQHAMMFNNNLNPSARIFTRGMM
eukprot:TRINITY_DN42684_c2_g1_i1.p1 TRINITY_DN42684_c2_g1~~TRINITY_DN42684_c2_g1_i1.p1  ORF type:complete len:145 (+),score=22.68 TRINITY_DN42684_c2_g1_i1:103-537(+)